jgi:hypothetical protein
MEDRLRYILSNVNDWLKFAEGKNAALLAANSAIVVGALRLVDGKEFIFQWAEYYFYFSIAMSSLGGVLCLLSFVPKVKIPWLLPTSLSHEKDNLVFYGDISCYDPSSYVRALYTQNGANLERIDPFEEDLAEQIILNSRIALRKYQLFNAALWLDITALLTPVVSFILLVFLRRKGD